MGRTTRRNPPDSRPLVARLQPALPGFRPARPSTFWGSRCTPDLGLLQREAGLQDFVLQDTGVSQYFPSAAKSQFTAWMDYFPSSAKCSGKHVALLHHFYVY